ALPSAFARAGGDRRTWYSQLLRLRSTGTAPYDARRSRFVAPKDRTAPSTARPTQAARAIRGDVRQRADNLVRFAANGAASGRPDRFDDSLDCLLKSALKCGRGLSV